MQQLVDRDYCFPIWNMLNTFMPIIVTINKVTFILDI